MHQVTIDAKIMITAKAMLAAKNQAAKHKIGLEESAELLQRLRQKIELKTDAFVTNMERYEELKGQMAELLATIPED